MKKNKLGLLGSLIGVIFLVSCADGNFSRHLLGTASLSDESQTEGEGEETEMVDMEDTEEEEGVDAKAMAHVKEVMPRNDPQLEQGQNRIALDKKVKARIDCEVDPSTVTADTFFVKSESDTIACTFEFSSTGSSGTRIKCNHEGQDFLPDTVYCATLEGVKCMDGRDVETRTWCWLTKKANGGDGVVGEEPEEEPEPEPGEEPEEEPQEEPQEEPEEEPGG